MAGTYDQLQVLQDHAYRAFQVTDTTFRQIINDETGNTLVIQSRPTPGNFYTDVYWGNDRDKVSLEAPNVQNTVTNQQFRQVSQVDIKTGAVMQPYEWQSIGAQWIGITPEQQAMVWGRTAAESFMRKKIEALVASLVAFFSKGLNTAGTAVGGGGSDTEVAKVLDDQSGSSENDANKLDAGKLLQAQGKFGDMFGALSGVIMHSGAFFGMQGRNLDQYQRLFSYGTVFVDRTLIGLPIFVTDLPILTFRQGSVTKYRTLLLRPMAGMLYENGDYQQHFDISNGKTWIETTVQAQQTFNVKIRAATWANTSNIHPKLGTTDGANLLIGTHTNAGVLDNRASWERVGNVGSDKSRAVTFKELPGVMMYSQ